MRFRNPIALVLAALGSRRELDGDVQEPAVRVLTNPRGAMPFTNVERVHEPRAHSIKKELRRDLQADKMTGRQWKKLKRQMRRELRDD